MTTPDQPGETLEQPTPCYPFGEQPAAIPEAALNLTAGVFQFADTEPEDPAAPVPVTLQARTGKPIDHWYWGRLVHDLAGARIEKPKLMLDYGHHAPIGYLDNFEISDDALTVSGAIIPYPADPKDLAAEVAYRGRGGVPYEASINFSGSGIVLEELGAGFVTEVNGYEIEGPCVIVREWPLRGVAIVPYGADGGTATKFSSQSATPVSYKQRTPEPMTKKPTEAKPAELEQDPQATNETPETKPTELADPTKPAAPMPEKPAGISRDELERFTKQFGAKGSEYLLAGTSFEEALALQNDAQRAEIEQLQNKLSAAGPASGESNPAEFTSDPENGASPKKFADLIKIR